MILVDYRKGSKELLPYFNRIGMPAAIVDLPFGDFCFEGNGEGGRISVGVERKTLHDLMACIDDSRYIEQRRGMLEMYNVSFLLVEGHWKPHEDGSLMEGFRDGTSWGMCKFRNNRVAYSKLRRYLLSISLSGVVVLYSHNEYQTARDISEMFHWFDKKWDRHNSLLEIHKCAIPDLKSSPSLVRKWAADISDIGVLLSLKAEELFKTPIRLANSDEVDWMKIPRIGAITAKRIIKEIRG